MTRDRHVTWENFERDILEAKVPAILPIFGNPKIDLVFRPWPTEMGIAISLPALKPVRASAFEHIDVSAQSSPSGPVLKVSSSNPGIFRQVFPVLLEIADAVQIDGADPLTEVEAAIRRIADAIKLSPRLPIERKIGLWGEMCVLKRLVASRGADAVRLWHGWQKDRHDFRIGTVELEVKTTLGATASHMINGAEQLQESSGYSLYLVSILVSRADAGQTLLEQIREVEAALSGHPEISDILKDALKQLAIPRADLESDDEKFILRRALQLIPMSESLPRLTTTRLGDVLNADSLGRISDISYRVNVEGMALPDTAEEFRHALSWMRD